MGIITGIRDRVADRVLDYSYADTSASACRSFVNTVLYFRGKRDSLIGTNPEDFDLIQVCEVDSHGVIDDPRVIVLMSGASVDAYYDSFDDDSGEDEFPFHPAEIDTE